MNGSVLTAVNQYLTFQLGSEQFALNIDRVREVLDYAPETKIPRTPEYMLGVINLRGSVVPVIDLRLKLGTRAGKRTENTSVIISEIELNGELAVLGVLADAVQEVIDLADENIGPPPRIGASIDTDYIKGIAKQNDQFIMILDLDRVFSEREESGTREAPPGVSIRS